MNAQDFLNLANQLMSSEDPKSEAVLRTAVGRAYYAIYLSVRDWIEARFPEEEKAATGNSHERYCNCLRALQIKHHDLSLSRLARELSELKAKRTFADYYINTDEVQDIASTEECLLQAEQMLKDLEVLKAKYP